MSFPATFDEFAEQYQIVDKQEVYTNGTELIPIFRVKQWLDHADVAPKSEVAREIFEEICEYAEQQIEALSIAEKVDTSGADFFGGGKQAFVLLLDRIAELKKKYTEEQI